MSSNEVQEIGNIHWRSWFVVVSDKKKQYHYCDNIWNLFHHTHNIKQLRLSWILIISPCTYSTTNWSTANFLIFDLKMRIWSVTWIYKTRSRCSAQDQSTIVSRVKNRDRQEEQGSPTLQQLRNGTIKKWIEEKKQDLFERRSSWISFFCLFVSDFSQNLKAAWCLFGGTSLFYFLA